MRSKCIDCGRVLSGTNRSEINKNFCNSCLNLNQPELRKPTKRRIKPMPKVKVPTSSIEGQELLPSQVVNFRLDGFKPRLASKKDSVNLYPQMKIINDPNLNDKRVSTNLNSLAGWIMKDFCHALGVPLQGPEKDELPGEFQPENEPDPTKWRYVGPLLGKTGKLEIGQTPNQKGGVRNDVKRYFCAIPGCSERHSENLL